MPAAATAPGFVDEAIEDLRENGYTRIPSVASGNDVHTALKLVLQWRERTEPLLPEYRPHTVQEQQVVYNLQNKDIFFSRLMFNLPGAGDVLRHFLNDPWYKDIPPEKPNYILRSLLARSSQAPLILHIDSFVPYMGSHVFVMQCLLLLEDMDESNGCTLFVPGSHQSGKYASQASLSDAVPATGKAGDLLIWDSRVWHGALPNLQEHETRWGIIGTFCRWWLKQSFDITGTLPEGILEQLSEEEKSVMGYCSIPYRDEFTGIDFRRGYDAIPDKSSSR